MDLSEPQPNVRPYRIGDDPDPPVTATLVDRPREDSGAPVEQSSPPPPHRIWSVFVVVAASLVVFMLASAVMFFVAVFAIFGELTLARLSDPNLMSEVTQSRIGFPIVVVLPQLALIIPCVVAAYLSPMRIRQRLGLVRGNWPGWAWLSAMFATPMVGMFSGFVGGLFLEESDHLKELGTIFRDHGANGFLVPLALMIGATPAICEELLFRGYVQTRLTQSLGPVLSRSLFPGMTQTLGATLGIFMASLIFAAFHMDPVHVITVFPIGLFLGWITYRSGSLFPAMLGHFLNNTLSVVIMVLAPEDATDTLDLPSGLFLITILVAGMIGMIGTVVASVFFSRVDA